MKMKSSTRSLLPILITITVILANFSLLYIPYQSHANAAVVDSQAQDPDPNPPTEVATEAPTEAPTEVATDTPTEVATEVPTEVATEVATEAPTEVATEMPTEAPTEVATETPTEVATEAPTETPTETPPEGPGMSLMGASPLGGPMGPMPMGASGSSCELQITDAGDADPLTFEFTAIGTGIASYAWDFENDGTTDATVAGPVVHSYPAPAPGPDTYTVKLTCTPASDPDIVLYGMVTVGGGTVPIASFSVSSDWGVGTLSFSTTNNTIPTTGLDYLWEVTGPENYTSTEFEPGFALGTVGTYTVKLTATDQVSGAWSAAWRTVEVADYPPDADFNLVPNMGTAPLTVQVTGVDLGGGPITSWSWDFNGDSVPDATGIGPHNYTYNTNGTYWIRMDYAGPGGSGYVMKQVYVDDASGTVQADFTYYTDSSTYNHVIICFNNTSTGVITRNTWNFGDGSPVIEDNNATVCHEYAVTGQQDVVVTLHVEGINPSIWSEAAKNVTVVAAPLADFSASTYAMTWGDGPIDFTDLSLGIITDWLWDFGDGTTSTTQNPSYEYAHAGNYTIRLTVTGPGGSSYVEKAIAVAELAITCDFDGDRALAPYPGQLETYTSTIGNANGRTISYKWYVDGVEQSGETNSTFATSWAAEASHLVELFATAPDSPPCDITKTVNVAWAALGCSLTGDFNPAPNGIPVVYTANVTDDQGRPLSYKWFVDSGAGPVEQIGETGSTFSRTWNNVEPDETISFEVTAIPTGSCSDSHLVQVRWPDLICSISGNLNPIPQLPDDPTRSYTYTAVVSGLAGRTIDPADFTWLIDGNLWSTNPQASLSADGTQLTLYWAWNQEGPYDVTFNVVSSANSASCSNNPQETLNVSVPYLTCGIPLGDIDPVINDNPTYQAVVGNLFGRTITSYTWELLDGATVIDSATGGPVASVPGFNHLFTDPPDANKTYTIRYTIEVDQPYHTCSGEKPITVVNPGQGFTCGDQGNYWDTGDFTPESPTTDYTYGVYIDNYTHIPLDYTWTLIPVGGWGSGPWDILTHTGLGTDGIVYETFNGSALAPTGTYTLRVHVSNPADPLHTYDCNLDHALTVGEINVDYTFTVDNNAVPIDQDICLTNVSTNSHGTIDDLTYVWDLGTDQNTLGTQFVTTKDIPCFRYTTENQVYNITLSGSLNNLFDSQVYVFRIYGLQSISISKSSQVFAPANMSFSAAGINIFPGSYVWNFYQGAALLGTRSGQNVTFYFANPGSYRAVVTGQGNLGSTSAMVEFELISTSDIRAAFTPSIYGGIAPLEVCFTDNSIGSSINYWEWDFGDGSAHLIYNPGTKPASICHTYTTPGQTYNVTLLVSNGTLSATASNIIHTYNLLESQSSFSINPQGNGQYCFVAHPAAGATVTGWDFGDGTVISTGDLTICHTYQASGNYLVRMSIVRGGETGEVVRPLNVTPNTNTPALQVTSSCSAMRTASFTVTNTGGDMLVADEIRFLDHNGNVILIDSLKLNSGQHKDYNLPGMEDNVTITALDNPLTGTVTTTCEYNLTGLEVTTSTCGVSPITFTVTNNSPNPMVLPHTFTIIQDGSVNVTPVPGTFQLNSGDSTTFMLPPGSNPYASYVFSTSGYEIDLFLTHDCANPNLSVTTNTCSAVVPSTISFTVTNAVGAGDMLEPQGFTVTRNGVDITSSAVGSNPFTLAAGTSTTISIPASTTADLYAVYVFSTTGFAGTVNRTHNCAPNLTVNSVCSASVAFTVTNNGGPMADSQNVTVMQGVTSMTLDITSFQLAAGASTTITVTGPTPINPYARYDFTGTGGSLPDTLYTRDCTDPVINVNFNCRAAVSAIITNSGGAMFLPMDVAITQGGTAQTLSANTFMLGAGGSTTITVTGPLPINPYLPYDFTATDSNGFLATINRSRDCPDPSISVSSSCAYPITFRVTNTGGQMFVAQTVTVTEQPSGTPMTTLPTSFTLGGGGAFIDIPITGGHNPYAQYDFVSTGGFLADTTYTHTPCPMPNLSVTTSGCGLAISFTVSNAAGAGNMLAPQAFTVTRDGTDITGTITPGSTFQLNAGTSQTFSVPGGSNPYAAYVFTSNSFAGSITETHDCPEPVIQVTSSCAYPITFTVTNTGGPMYLAQNVTVTQQGTGTTMSLSAGSFTLGTGDSTPIWITDVPHNPYAQYNFAATGGFSSDVAYTHLPCPSPALSVTYSNCGTDIAFTVTNTGGDMLTPQAYTVTQDGTDITASMTPGNTFLLTASGGMSQTFSGPAGSNPYSAYVFTSNDFAGNITATRDCPDPVIQVSSSCAYPITFTVTNTGGPMYTSQNVIVTQGVTLMPLNANSFSLASGASTTFWITGSHNPYLQYDFMATGVYLPDVTYTHVPCSLPGLSVTTNACGAAISFTVTNAAGSGNMLIPQAFTVTQDGVDITASMTPNTPFQLNAGQSQTFTVPAGSNPYSAYVFTSNDVAGSIGSTHDCNNPNLNITTNLCGPTITFTVTNTGGDMLIPQAYTVTQDGADITASMAPGSPFMLTAAGGNSQTFTVPAGSDPYAAYVFDTGGFAGTHSLTHDCDNPNLSDLDVETNTCGPIVEFTVTNNGGDMLVPQPFTVLQNGTDVTAGVTSGGVPASDFQLNTGASQVFTLPADSNPYYEYLFSTSGFAGDAFMVHDCLEPVLALSSLCTADNHITFTIANVGADMLVPNHFVIKPGDGFEIDPLTDQFQLYMGGSITFSLKSTDPFRLYEFYTDEWGIMADKQGKCNPSEQYVFPTSTPVPGAEAPTLGGGFLPLWSAVPVCPHSCPPWLLYHTNQTGDWEIFRLDGYDEQTRQTFSEDLSHGVGPGIDDMAPSRSPDGNWIVFTSNRDGNWEIYLAPSNGDESKIQRLTYNNIAIDTDPIWGPTNYIAYESTRDGNWEIYIMDMSTGYEYRATSSSASDINPFWSPDGSKIVFQSDRDGLWQIYELDLNTLGVTRLSDGSGNDVDPEYSFDGAQIVFRSYRDGAGSIIYVMNADGTNPHSISSLEGDATNPAWSPDDHYIAYQSYIDGDLDVYVYDTATGETYKVSNGTANDYAPMWRCDSETIVFTSEITGNPDIFEVKVELIKAQPIDLLKDAHQMTFEPTEDIYPEGMPPEENASREGHLPPLTIGNQGEVLGMQTDYLKPDTSLTPPDLSYDGVRVKEFRPVNACPIPGS